MLDAIVVGAGQAGLSTSYFLKRLGLSHFVLEKGRVAESWRSQRWDSFAVNSPNTFNHLPGDPYNGPRPDGFYTRNELAASFDRYAERFALPILEGVKVTDVTFAEGGYRVQTREGNRIQRLRTRCLVVAAGGQRVPKAPPFARELPARIAQFHAGTYRNPSALPDGAVLVVGSGQSGCQIAEELAASGRKVYLSTSKVGRWPRRYRGRDILEWVREMGMLDVKRSDVTDPSVFREPQPQVSGLWRYGRTLSLQQLMCDGVELIGGIGGVEGNRVTLKANLRDCVLYGDEKSATIKRQIDDYVANNRIAAPEPELDPADRPWDGCGPADPAALDLSAAGIESVIWCTGFKQDFSWLQLPCINRAGEAVHRRGISALPGVYFVGLPWLYKRKSGIIAGVAEDAAHIAQHLGERIAAWTGSRDLGSVPGEMLLAS